ncbi:MAG: AAA family ATPase [Mycoplasmataceae bacterium]|jgi:hypothetical protein|nr:AAA family ATPase [Mycoplasmataceae bacterium]
MAQIKWWDLCRWPKNSGKTMLCSKFAKSFFYLNDDNIRKVIKVNQKIIVNYLYLVLIDEGQYLPSILNQTKLAIDNNKIPGMFLLTGSIIPISTNLDVADGRIIYCTLRTMTLTEMNISSKKVSFNKLISDKDYSFNNKC